MRDADSDAGGDFIAFFESENLIANDESPFPGWGGSTPKSKSLLGWNESTPRNRSLLGQSTAGHRRTGSDNPRTFLLPAARREPRAADCSPLAALKRLFLCQSAVLKRVCRQNEQLLEFCGRRAPDAMQAADAQLLAQLDEQHRQTLDEVGRLIDYDVPERSVATFRVNLGDVPPQKVVARAGEVRQTMEGLAQQFKSSLARLAAAKAQAQKAARRAEKIWPRVPGTAVAPAALYADCEEFFAGLGLAPGAGPEAVVEGLVRLEAFALHRFEEFAALGAERPPAQLQAAAQFCCDLSFMASQLSSLSDSKDHAATLPAVLGAGTLRAALAAFRAQVSDEAEYALFCRLSAFLALGRAVVQSRKIKSG